MAEQNCRHVAGRLPSSVPSTSRRSPGGPTETVKAPAPTATAPRAGRYLTFLLAGEEYGLEIFKVREIIGIMDITDVPQTPSHVKGVVNLRGKVITAIDLRLKFGLEAARYTDATCIIVVNVHGLEIGIVVDNVSEVLDIDEKDIEDAPSFGQGVDTDFIRGIGKTRGTVKILLDIDEVLVAADVAGVVGAQVQRRQ